MATPFSFVAQRSPPTLGVFSAKRAKEGLNEDSHIPAEFVIGTVDENPAKNRRAMRVAKFGAQILAMNMDAK